MTERPSIRPTEPRITPVDLSTDQSTDPVDPELLQILDGALTHDGTPLNIFGALGRHPKLLKRFNLLGGFLLNKGLLPERERELVILRIGWNAQAVYEFGQHTIIGRRCGLTDAEITAITTTPLTTASAATTSATTADATNADAAPDDHRWSDEDHDLLAMADELTEDDCVTDVTWARLAARWSEAELVELLVVAGFYRLVSGFLNSAGVQLDNGVPGFPA